MGWTSLKKKHLAKTGILCNDKDDMILLDNSLEFHM